MTRLAFLVAGTIGGLALAADVALAEDRAFCAGRPGQTTPPCTLEPGRVMIETGFAEWTRQAEPSSRTDSLALGSSQLRAGLTPRLEAQLGWTPIGIEWVRDTATAAVARQTSVGDVTLGLTYGLAGPNGPVALQGFLTLPTGGRAIGAGDWGAGVRLPVAVDLGGGFELGLTPEVGAAVNGSGNGRHLIYGGAAGIGMPLSDELDFGLDVAVFRDDDPDGPATRASGGAALAWQASKNTQFDIGGTLGLNRSSPDGTIYFGIAHRF